MQELNKGKNIFNEIQKFNEMQELNKGQKKLLTKFKNSMKCKD
jgi:hypothetical protein